METEMEKFLDSLSPEGMALIAFAMVALNFIPSVIAFRKRHGSKWAIVFCNVIVQAMMFSDVAIGTVFENENLFSVLTVANWALWFALLFWACRTRRESGQRESAAV